ncbi:hypothetical protein TNCV_4603771 [Trichonephila clavipes]|nr:hypothetical protein TNCV_4603771 [Trichonephila clavipes]
MITQATHPRNQTGKKVFLLHHDNASPHCNAPAQDVMGKLNITVVPQPTFRPYLAPSDFWLFPKLKEALKGQRFPTDAEGQTTVR